MAKSTTIIFILFAFTSCFTTKKTTQLSSDYWQKAPDLSTVIYTGGNGKSADSAIIVKNAGNERNGVAAEYAYISNIYGEKSVVWKIVGQSSNLMNGRRFDIIQIQTIPQKENITCYFDITDYYGKL